jgi:citrate synthase
VAKETLTTTDDRAGKTYEILRNSGIIRAMDLKQIKVSQEDFGIMSYDPHWFKR